MRQLGYRIPAIVACCRLTCMGCTWPYLKTFGALLKCLCPLGAKGAARYVLYVASIDHALPVALNVRFLRNVQTSL